MKASDYIAKRLAEAGVTSAYGYTGGAITHTVDSLGNLGIRFINFNHEQGAIFAASGASKADNRIRVLLATSGPGATNLLTGIAEAYFDSVPLLIITGQVNTYDFKWDKKCRQIGFQETDIVSIAKPITKYATLVSDPKMVVEELEKCIQIALSDRPGPVVLDIPMDVQRAEIDAPKHPHAQETHKKPELSRALLEEIAALIADAKRPLMLVGNGCKIADAKEELVRVAHALDVPVVVSLLGKGCFPEDDALFLGFIGSYGQRHANIALAHADVILVTGARLDSRQTGNKLGIFKGKRIIQVDIDPDEIGVKLDIVKPVPVDARQFLVEFHTLLRTKSSTTKHTAWRAMLRELQQRFTPFSELERAQANPFHYEVMQEISNRLAPDDIVCVDIGQVQMVAAQIFEMRAEQKFITSGGLAPMGYALPAAIGVALETGKRAISINGDGGMQINIQELNLIAKKRLPVVTFVFDNKALGMIKQFQDLYFGGRYYGTDESHEYYSCDFAQIAQAYGIPSITIHNGDTDWKEKIDGAMRSREPILVHLVLDYDTKVYPKLRFDRTLDNPEPELSKDEDAFIKKRLDATPSTSKMSSTDTPYYDG